MSDPTQLSRPGKRLAMFYDGTWNKPEDQTNVWRLKQLLADKGRDGVPQLPNYDPGVGTHWYDRLTGGMFGAGLSQNIQEGYDWLRRNYQPGDEIFLFGFSRGAFTARSLAGFIARCGLLRPEAPMSVEQAYERYRQGDAARPIYDLLYRQRNGETNFNDEERMLLQHSIYQHDLIKMVGVWDTVGSIGLPFGNIPGVSKATLHFHNTHLSRIVKHSYQALALDEHRKPYWAILWTNYRLKNPPAGEPPRTDDRFIEQRWFTGAHSNVGGGYEKEALSLRPCAWIQEKAVACGLGFREAVVVNEDDLNEQPRDSYGEFLGGAWKWFSIFKLFKRYVRWVMSAPKEKPEHKRNGRLVPAGIVQTVNERIDLSVIRRCQRHADYRPASLIEWAERKGLKLQEVIARPEDHPDLWSPVTRPGVET